MADYQAHRAQFEQNGIAVYALSTDDAQHAQEMVERHGLSFPVLYGVDGPATAAAWGAHYEERRNIIHATSFILQPSRRIANATYSTGPAGRLVAEDALRVVAFLKKQAAKR